jgi:hypothetical protein
MKHLLTLFLFVATIGIAQAQNAQVDPVRDRAHQQAVRMQKVVALTPEQTTKVEEIFFQRATAVEAVNNNAALSPEQKAAEVDKIKREKEVELQAVLTPEQYQKYQEMREERKKGK